VKLGKADLWYLQIYDLNSYLYAFRRCENMGDKHETDPENVAVYMHIISTVFASEFPSLKTESVKSRVWEKC
jgi:hypothetical protein